MCSKYKILQQWMVVEFNISPLEERKCWGSICQVLGPLEERIHSSLCWIKLNTYLHKAVERRSLKPHKESSIDQNC